jgi:coenzyme F420-reducing hydrogenase gamma subunit
MENEKERTNPPRVRPRERAPESLGCACPCGIPKNKFPCMGSCFRQSAAAPDNDCEAVCPHCGIWTSLPEGVNLKVTRIFDCALMGYGKRITKEDR